MQGLEFDSRLAAIAAGLGIAGHRAPSYSGSRRSILLLLHVRRTTRGRRYRGNDMRLCTCFTMKRSTV